MQAYTYDLTMEKSGVLTLKNLPFNAGERIEVIILSRSKPKRKKISILFGENQLHTLTQPPRWLKRIGRYTNDRIGYACLGIV